MFYNWKEFSKLNITIKQAWFKAKMVFYLIPGIGSKFWDPVWRVGSTLDCGSIGPRFESRFGRGKISAIYFSSVQGYRSVEWIGSNLNMIGTVPISGLSWRRRYKLSSDV